jgi:hypothetical protein
MWVCDVPDFYKGWVSEKGYLLLDQEKLLFISTEGDWELIESVDDLSSYEEVDILEVEGLGLFVQQSRVERSPIEYKGLQLSDSSDHWGWNEHGLWIDISQ